LLGDGVPVIDFCGRALTMSMMWNDDGERRERPRNLTAPGRKFMVVLVLLILIYNRDEMGVHSSDWS